MSDDDKDITGVTPNDIPVTDKRASGLNYESPNQLNQPAQQE